MIMYLAYRRLLPVALNYLFFFVGVRSFICPLLLVGLNFMFSLILVYFRSRCSLFLSLVKCLGFRTNVLFSYCL